MTLRAVAGGGGNANNPMTSLGQMIYGANSGIETALNPGPSGSILTMGTSIPTWSTVIPSGSVLSPIIFSASQTVGQSLTGGTYQKITINSVNFDTASYFDLINHRFTPQVAGYYLIIGQVGIAASSELAATIYKNGVGYAIGQDNGSGENTSVVSCIVYLNGSTDYVELWAYVGASVNTLIKTDSNYFQGSLLR